MKYIISAYKNYINFSGRATRREFWVFYLFVVIFAEILALVDATFGLYALQEPQLGLLWGIFYLVTYVPILAIHIRRLHDTDRTGWWILAPITIIGIIPLIIFLLLKGNGGNNRFGPPSDDADTYEEDGADAWEDEPIPEESDSDSASVVTRTGSLEQPGQDRSSKRSGIIKTVVVVLILLSIIFTVKDILLEQIQAITTSQEHDEERVASESQPDSPNMLSGKTIHTENCSFCHGADGEGKPGLQVPSLLESALIKGDKAAHIHVVLHGRSKSAMMSYDSLSNDEIAAVINYQRNAFGGSGAGSVTPSDVQRERSQGTRSP